jgi:hypothetical protein
MLDKDAKSSRKPYKNIGEVYRVESISVSLDCYLSLNNVGKKRNFEKDLTFSLHQKSSNVCSCSWIRCCISGRYGDSMGPEKSC